ncbi:MAG: S8 family serine peptidase [Chloroflexota bacterium]|nr:S8 family serine peptidase [Chloroflexota bacterium]
MYRALSVLISATRVIIVMLLGCTLWINAAPGYAQTSTRSLSADETALLARLQREARVRVIVHLEAPFAADADSATAAASQTVIDSVRSQVIDAVAGTGNARLLSTSDEWVIPYVALEVDSAAYQELLAQPGVIAVVPDVRLHMQTGTQTASTGADSLWAAGHTGAGQTIAVLDNGVAAAHSAFGGRVVEEACFSSASSVSTSLCPSGEDWQFGAGSASPARCLALYGTSALCEHGTHVASIAAGGDSTMQGMASGARIVAIQVFAYFGGTTQPETWIADVIAGLNHVYGVRSRYAIAAVNLSIGGALYSGTCNSAESSMTAIFGMLRTAGIVPVVAAGNNGSSSALTFPACISHAVSVGAATSDGGRAGFSNSLPSQLTLFAPGVNIYAAYPTGYSTLSGTSMAAPHVAGAIALLRAATPGASSEQIIAALRSTGAPVAVPNGSTPRINVAAAHGALAGSTLTVSLTLPGRPAAPHARLIVPLTVRVTRTSDNGLIVDRAISTDSYGRFTLAGLAVGSYRVHVKSANSLALAGIVTVSATPATLNLGGLPTGDSNNDNAVSIIDFSQLASAFGTSRGISAHDYNADGTVNISDFSLLAASFGTVGAAR